MARRQEVLEAILSLTPQDAEAQQALFGSAGVSEAPRVPYDAYAGMEAQPLEVQDGYEPIYPDYSAQPYQQPAGGGYDASPQLYEGIDEIADIEEIEEIEAIEELDASDNLDDVIVVEQSRSSEEEIRRLLTETDVFVKYGLYDKAIEHLQKIFDSQPHHVEAHEKLKDLYVQLGDVDQAVIELLYLTDLYAESDVEAALYYLQQVFQLAPDHQEAVERMQRLSSNVMPSVDYSNPPGGLSVEANEFVVTMEGSGDLASGYPVTDHRSGADPLYQVPGSVTTSEQANPLALGDSTLETMSPEADVAEAPQGAPASAALEEELEEVEFFIQQGLFDEARNMLVELSQAYPANRLVAEKLNEVNNQDNVDEFLDQSFDLGSQIPNELGEGEEFSQPLDDQDGVKDVFEQFKQGVAQQVDAGDANTHYDLGVAYKEMGLVEDAVAEFEIARENPEREAIAQTMIGDCYVQAGQLSEAINAYKRGLYAEYKAPEEELQLYYALGSAYLALGDTAEALYYFQKVAKREPNFRDVQQQITSLQGGG